jgi:hypothetical protein
MSKFRKKPVVIDAFQWTADIDQTDDPIWIVEAIKAGRVEIKRPVIDGARLGLHIHTLEGSMVARVGDWIIRGVEGEIYPCKPDIFAATYEPVHP